MSTTKDMTDHLSSSFYKLSNICFIFLKIYNDKECLFAANN